MWDATSAGHRLRRADAVAAAGLYASSRCSRSRSASAPTPRSSASSTPCSGGRLPYRGSERLIVSVAEQRPREGHAVRTGCAGRFLRLASRQPVVLVVRGAVDTRAVNISGGGEPERLRALAVSRLSRRPRHHAGPRPRLHGLTRKSIGRHRVVLLTDGFWRRRFGADRRSSAERSRWTATRTTSSASCPGVLVAVAAGRGRAVGDSTNAGSGAAGGAFPRRHRPAASRACRSNRRATISQIIGKRLIGAASRRKTRGTRTEPAPAARRARRRRASRVTRAARRRGPRAADRVRERRDAAAGACDRPPEGARGPHRGRRGAGPSRQADADREPAARACRRRRRRWSSPSGVSQRFVRRCSTQFCQLPGIALIGLDVRVLGVAIVRVGADRAGVWRCSGVHGVGSAARFHARTRNRAAAAAASKDAARERSLVVAELALVAGAARRRGAADCQLQEPHRVSLPDFSRSRS